MTARERADRRLGILMLAPAVVTLGALSVYPGVWVVWLSLQERIPIFQLARFVGPQHFAFLAGDRRFWSALATTLTFTVASVALELVLGVAVALALARQHRGRRLGLSLLLLAWAMPAVVTARMFEWLYHPAAGLVNYVLGLGVAGGVHLNWLGDPHLALPAVILADVWRTMPFVAVLAYARLLGIPPEMHEAAIVDGAGRVAELMHVTLPLLRRVLMIAVLFRTLDALRAFDIMFILTGGGPAGVTETISIYAYRTLFQMLQFGFGSAIGVVVFALVMALAWIYLRLLARADAAA